MSDVVPFEWRGTVAGQACATTLDAEDAGSSKSRSLVWVDALPIASRAPIVRPAVAKFTGTSISTIPRSAILVAVMANSRANDAAAAQPPWADFAICGAIAITLLETMAARHVPKVILNRMVQAHARPALPVRRTIQQRILALLRTRCHRTP